MAEMLSYPLGEFYLHEARIPQKSKEKYCKDNILIVREISPFIYDTNLACRKIASVFRITDILFRVNIFFLIQRRQKIE